MEITYNVINIREFGASPNGDSDCSGIFKKAEESLTNGGIIFFPRGEYLFENPIRVNRSNLTLIGEGRQSRIIYTYEQTEEDNATTASLFSFEDYICDINVKDLYLEYKGEYFDEAQKSYFGKVSAFYFGICFDVAFKNVEITRFNSNAIAFMGSPSDYSKRLKVDKCYLHHNRVAGVLYGYVDGISITNNNLEYHGSKYDGGTGYGCAGSSGGIPLNVQIIGNKASLNYRKGIDLHAGKKAVIEGNICEGNVLCAIYAEGRYANDIIVTGNMITNMSLIDTPYPPIYKGIEGIGFGIYGGVKDDTEERNFVISENELLNFSFENGSAVPFNCYYGLHRGSVQIKNNILNLGKVATIVGFNGKGPHTEACKNNISITGNQIKCRECTYSPFLVSSFDTYDFSHNRVEIEKGRYPFIASPGDDNGALICTYNNLSCSELHTYEDNTDRSSSEVEKIFRDSGKIDYPRIIEKNILNGKVI